MMVNNINNKWIKRQIFTRDELLAIINTEIKNSMLFFSCIAGIIGLSIIFAMLFSSTSLLGFYAIMFIGLIATLIIISTILPLFLSWFIRFRYKYLATSTTDRGMINRKNYDAIDEQLIEGINRFKKEKLTI
jgi:ABC-type multidrug transport system permease subunit